MNNVRNYGNNVPDRPFDWDDSQNEEYIRLIRVCRAVCAQAACVQCWTTWHGQIACELNRCADPTNIIFSLVERCGWRACFSCRHMIEMLQGDCTYIVCRCGRSSAKFFKFSCTMGYWNTWSSAARRCAKLNEPSSVVQPLAEKEVAVTTITEMFEIRLARRVVDTNDEVTSVRVWRLVTCF